MTTTLQTLTASVRPERVLTRLVAGRQAADAQRRAARWAASADAPNRTGVAGLGHLPQSMPPRTR